MGYWFDYIDFDKKYIIEWDEEHHFINNSLSDKDLKRQKEIESYYTGFCFLRIREKTFLKMDDKEKFQYILKQINTYLESKNERKTFS